MGLVESKSALDGFLQRSKTAKNLSCPLMTIETKQETYHFVDVRKQALADPGDGDIYLELFWSGHLPLTLKIEFQVFKTIKDTLDEYGGQPVGPFRVAECPGKSLIGLPIKVPRDSLESLGEDMFTGEGHTDAHTAQAMSGFNLTPFVNPSLSGSSRIELLFANSLNLTARTDTDLARLKVGKDLFEFTDIRQNQEHKRTPDNFHYVLFWKALGDDVDVDSYDSPKFVAAVSSVAPYLAVEGPTRCAGCVLPLLGVPVSLTLDSAIELGSQLYLGFSNLATHPELPVRPPEAPVKAWTEEETKSWLSFISQPQLLEVFQREQMQPQDLLALEGADFDSLGLDPAALTEFKLHLEALKTLQM